MSMRLSDLLRGVIAIDTRLDRDIAELSLDSKSMSPGAAFVALRGHQHHGIEFAAEAVARGAAIVLAEAPLPDVVQLDVPVVAISDLRRHLGTIAHRFYDGAATGLRLIGVTGTNGKTSSVLMIAQALTDAGESTGTIGIAPLRACVIAVPPILRWKSRRMRLRKGVSTHSTLRLPSSPT